MGLQVCANPPGIGVKGLLGRGGGDLQQRGRALHDPHQQPVDVALQLLHMLVPLAQLPLPLQEQADELVVGQVVVFGRLVQHTRVLRPDGGSVGRTASGPPASPPTAPLPNPGPRSCLCPRRQGQPNWLQGSGQVGPGARPASCSSLPGTPPPPPNLETPGISSERHTSGLKPRAPCRTSPSASWRPQSGQPGGLAPQAERCRR